MAKKQGQKEAWQNDFVDYELTEDGKRALREYFRSDFDEFEAMGAWLAEGYKLTFRMDNRGGGVACWISHSTTAHANSGLVLAGRGSSYRSALAEATFKHSMYRDGVWPRKGKAEFLPQWDELEP